MNKTTLRGCLAAGILGAAVFAGPAFAQGQSQNARQKADDGAGDIIVHGKNPNQVAGAPTAGGTGSLSPISNHGGPIMVKPNVFLIWYGTWSNASGSDTAAGQQIVRDFLAGLNGSPYYNINTTYSGVGGTPVVSGNFVVVNEYTDTGSQGTNLSDRSIKNIVTNAISKGFGGTPDSNGIYFVLTSSNVAKSGFCSQYCGWHTAMTYQGKTIQYSFVGNANRCLNACAAQSIGPNGNAGVDGMVSVLAHELEETNSDPHLNAWYDSSGAENADKCAWTFGGAQTQLSSGAWYNMTLGSRKFLIQRNLDATNNKCYVSYQGQQ